MRKNLKEFWGLKKDVILAFIISVLGVVASVFLYSLTGYGIDSIGLFARTTIAISFWLIIGLVLLTSLSLNQTFTKKVMQICLYGIIGFFVFASTNRTLEWAHVWETQKKVLASAPIEQIKKVGEKDLVVFVGPYIYKGIHIFAAIWDITSAVNNSHSELLERKYRTSFTVQRDWESVWDGEKLVQINSITNQKVWEIPAEKVWVWDYPKGQFYELEAPAKIAPQNSGN
jgi:hypothetical protein